MERRKILVGLFFVMMVPLANAGDDLPPPSHGIQYPLGWQDWAVLAVSHRTDNQTLRVILGNDTAIRAARSGRTNPWPDGTILGKVVWKKRPLKDWSEAMVPGELVHAEFMLKDSGKYRQTYGWGWARWLGLQQKPFNDGPQVCISCHEPVKERDWVFTDPAAFPKRP